MAATQEEDRGGHTDQELEQVRHGELGNKKTSLSRRREGAGCPDDQALPNERGGQLDDFLIRVDGGTYEEQTCVICL